MRLLLSEALARLHAQQVEILRLSTRLGERLDADRALRRGAHSMAPTGEIDRKRGPRG